MSWSWVGIMVYKISEKCLKCNACIWEKVCKAMAIEKHNEVFSINLDKCIDCGTCYNNQQYFCPVRAIVKE
jgi:TPP-dependent indolepyruvate ferredoxin oxidoreductase alpha subunit